MINTGNTFPEKLYRVLDDPSSGEECTSSDFTAGAHLLGVTDFPEWDFDFSELLIGWYFSGESRNVIVQRLNWAPAPNIFVCYRSPRLAPGSSLSFQVWRVKYFVENVDIMFQ